MTEEAMDYVTAREEELMREPGRSLKPSERHG